MNLVFRIRPVTLVISALLILSIQNSLLLEGNPIRASHAIQSAADPPVLEEAITDESGTRLYLTFSREMVTGISSHQDFILEARGAAPRTIEIGGIAVDDVNSSMLVLTLSQLAFIEDLLYLSYSGKDVTSTELVPLASFESQYVTNNGPGMPPEVLSAEVMKHGLGIRVIFSKLMDDLSSVKSDLTVRVDGQVRPMTLVNSSGAEMIIILDEPLIDGEVVTLSYQGASAGSADRGVLKEFTDKAVTGRSIDPPTIVSIPGVIYAELLAISLGIELEECLDVGGGQNLTELDAGDFAEYVVNVEHPGIYKGTLRVASASNSGRLNIQVRDTDMITDLLTVEIPVSGGPQLWRSVPVEITLEEGLQQLRLKVKTEGFNLNFLSLDYQGNTVHDRTVPKEISIYPNPAENWLHIVSTSGPINEVEIIDILGKKVMYEAFKPAAEEASIKLTLKEGIYMVKVRSDGEVNVQSLVVE